jgi:hypothetical protein
VSGIVASPWPASIDTDAATAADAGGAAAVIEPATASDTAASSTASRAGYLRVNLRTRTSGYRR